MSNIDDMKLTFSGHDSFHCRQFWLKKAFDHSSNDLRFNDAATVQLGVGRNMVSAVRHWAKCFDILDDNEVTSEFANNLLSVEGWDPYLEDIGSLWLLHYKLVSREKASAFSIVFNDLIQLRNEITLEYFITHIQNIDSNEYNENTLKRDFGVFYNTYQADYRAKDIEESFNGILSELGLLKKVQKQVLDVEGKLRSRDVWLIERSKRENIPLHIFLYALLVQNPNDTSIGFERIYNERNSAGKIFALNKDGVTTYLERLEKELDYGITFSNEAGIRELQFNNTLNPQTILEDYYV